MAVDMFLKIDGIEGDSTSDKYKGWIDVLSFGWGATNATTFSTSGGFGSGKVNIQDFSFVKQPDMATAKLFRGVATGQHFTSATLSLVKAGGSQVEFMKLKMSDVLVTGYQTGGSAGMLPAEQVSFSFSKVELSTAEQKADGTIGAWDTISFDIAASKSV
jgi:type VI secretion system secreted protein Hcp